jgi:hypothetical protein
VHPNLRHKYGLRSDLDVALAKRMKQAALMHGWLAHQIDALFTHYGQLAKKADAGEINAAGILQQLEVFASEKLGVGFEKRSALFGAYRAVDAYMKANGGELPPMTETHTADRAALAEIEEIMRTDFPRYLRDQQMQDKYYELLQGSIDNRLPIANDADIARVAHIETLMGNPSSDYWRGENAAALQSEYRALLDMADPATLTGE